MCELHCPDSLVMSVPAGVFQWQVLSCDWRETRRPVLSPLGVAVAAKLGLLGVRSGSVDLTTVGSVRRRAWGPGSPCFGGGWGLGLLQG